MSRVIHKATLFSGSAVVAMNAESKIVHVAEQGGNPTIWYEFDSAAPIAHREFRVIGTGFAYEVGLVHLGTAMVGPLVLHVFERPEDSE